MPFTVPAVFAAQAVSRKTLAERMNFIQRTSMFKSTIVSLVALSKIDSVVINKNLNSFFKNYIKMLY